MAKSPSHCDPKNNMATHLNDQMSQLNIDNQRNINILILGETGVNKSTFINSFYNYLKYSNLRSAMKDDPVVLIPTKFTIMDEDFKQQVVEIGKNELIQTGASAAQATRSYIFPIREENANIRLIDTPGIGDARGIDFDNINFENILDFIGELEHLNGICILLKPDNPRLTVQFEYCIKQIFSKLNKSACENLIFVFTNTRSTFYRPGETFPALQRLFEGIQNVEIPFQKKNIFCVDNEAFRFWAAHHSGIKFSSDDIENFSQSWKKSFMECWRMINYIAGTNDNVPLRPHLVKHTTSINEARRLILKLSQPLTEIEQMIEDNMNLLQRHKKQLESSDDQIKQLSVELYIPITNLEITPLKHPATVCTAINCSELYKVNNVEKWHYKQKCCSPCSLRGVPKDRIGLPSLAYCAAMNGQPCCEECGCEFQKHMHIYYSTETFADKVENENIKSEISNQKSVFENAKIKIEKIEEFLDEFKEEKDVILKTTAKCAHFLQTNAITPYNNAYEGYLLYLIDREKSLGDHVDYNAVRVLESMLGRYEEEKRILSNALSMQSDGANEITAKEVIECVDTLYTLKHNGHKIKQLFLIQNPARVAETKREAREGVYATKGSKNWANKMCYVTKTDSKKSESKKRKARRNASSLSSKVDDGPKKNKGKNVPNFSEILSNVKEDKVLDCRDVPDISTKPIPENDSQDNKDFNCVCAVSDSISPESVVDNDSEKNNNQILSVSSDTPSELDVKEGPQENKGHVLNDSSDTSSESDGREVYNRRCIKNSRLGNTTKSDSKKRKSRNVEEDQNFFKAHETSLKPIIKDDSEEDKDLYFTCDDGSQNNERQVLRDVADTPSESCIKERPQNNNLQILDDPADPSESDVEESPRVKQWQTLNDSSYTSSELDGREVYNRRCIKNSRLGNTTRESRKSRNVEEDQSFFKAPETSLKPIIKDDSEEDKDLYFTCDDGSQNNERQVLRDVADTPSESCIKERPQNNNLQILDDPADPSESDVEESPRVKQWQTLNDSSYTSSESDGREVYNRRCIKNSRLGNTTRESRKSRNVEEDQSFFKAPETSLKPIKGSRNWLNRMWNFPKTNSKKNKTKKKKARRNASNVSSKVDNDPKQNKEQSVPNPSEISSNIEDGLKESEQSLPNVSEILSNVKEDKVLDCRDVPDISSEPIPEGDSQGNKDFDCACAVSDNISAESVVDDDTENNNKEEGPQKNKGHILNDSSDTSSESDGEEGSQKKKRIRNDLSDTSSKSELQLSTVANSHSHDNPKKEMATDLNGQIDQLNTANRKNINILLLGETGVGKSTFINALYNYLKYPELKSAMENEFEVLIPTKFTITDENYKPQVIDIGTDANTPIQNGASMTQFTEHYNFPLKRRNANIRLIDTPGIGDARGIDMDDCNFENILDFIGKLKHLNAICILLPPDNSRLTVQFEYIIKQFFSKLNKSVCDNLIFVLTNSRGTLYRPGKTLTTLHELFERIENVEIPLEKKNIFCVDNEAFRFWTAHHRGIQFNPDDVKNFLQSWKISFNECWRLINYIVGTDENIPLKPRLVKNIISVNEARRLMLKLSQPLAEIAQLIEDNVFALQRHKNVFQSSDEQIKQLSKDLYIPITGLKITPLKDPAMVCTSTKCINLYKVNGVERQHYKQVYHSPCSLGGIPKEIIGSPLLADCAAMNGQPFCQKCGCEYQKHMLIYYSTETFEDKLENENVKSEINNQKLVQKIAKTKILKIEEFLDEFKKEKDVILKTTAKFAHFLQTNAITPYNDAYEGYLLYLIDREKSVGARVNYNAVLKMKTMLKRYNEEKKILSYALNTNSDGANEITTREVIEFVDKLYALKYNGKNIKKLLLARKPARTKRKGIRTATASKNCIKIIWKGRFDASNTFSKAANSK